MPNLFGESEPVASFGRYARVALEQGLEKPQGLTYGVPDKMADLRTGDRVIVPLGRGNRTVSGYVLDVSTETDIDPRKLKPIAARDREQVNLPDDLVELARWISRYYCCPLGMVFPALMPSAVSKGTGLKRKIYIEPHEHLMADAVDSVIEQHKLRGKQRDVVRKIVQLAEHCKTPVERKRLADLAGAKTVGPINALVDKGILDKVEKTEVTATEYAHVAEDDPKIMLNADQTAALETVAGSLGAFGVNLLRGVTGSGKTEVYIRIIERVVQRGQTAIVLVPEIALTPQTAGRFVGRFKNVAILHSGLTAAQRHAQWQLIRSGWAKVVVGARSAVFAPLENLGLIVVDEEHDTSYKQDQAPRYHARDVAVKRAQSLDCPVVLGSATPSLESYHNAKLGRYRLVELPNRVSDRPLPKVKVVDLLDERRKRAESDSRGVHLLSIELEDQLNRTFKDGSQALLLLNRRGYANYIACPDHNCGWQQACDHCDAHMVYHVDPNLPMGGLVRCHYCGFEQLLANRCPVCAKKTTVFGLGTQRVEDEIERKFPDVKYTRMDSDTMRTARHYQDSLDAFRRGETQLIIGTQMIAKGLDFPNVRLVGVISADTALSLPDFRATERTFQLVCQVAGRSGRGAAGGLVIVQSFNPTHPAIQLAAKHDYNAFASAEHTQRVSFNLPPITRMARIVCRDHELEKAESEATAIAAALRATDERLESNATIVGPMPAPIARIGGFHRQQVELTATDAATLQRLISDVRHAGLLRSDMHTAVDVDPTTLM